LGSCYSQKSCLDCEKSVGSINSTTCYWCDSYRPNTFDVNATLIPFCYNLDECLNSPGGCGNCIGSFLFYCPSQPNAGLIAGVLVGVIFILAVLVWIRISIPYWCGGHVLDEPLVDDHYKNDSNLLCCGYTESRRTFSCCYFLKPVSVEDDGVQYTVISDRIVFFVFMIVAIIMAIIVCLALAFNPDTSTVAWSGAMIILIALVSQLLFSWKYVTVFDRSSRNIKHTLFLGPCQLIPIRSDYLFSDIADVRVCVNNKYSKYYGHLKLIFHNGAEKIVLIDGDPALIKGTFWRIRREILEIINIKENSGNPI